MEHETREVDACTLVVCENGYVVEAVPTFKPAVVIQHSCGGWTFIDGNYCVHCGGKLE